MRICISFILVILLTSCAVRYKTINTDVLSYYKPTTINNELEVSYLCDVYQATGNTRYSNKERHNNFKTIAVKITNLSDSSILITKNNFKILAKDQQVPLAYLKEYFRYVRQTSGTYLLHALWSPRYTHTTGSGLESNTTTVYIPIGLAVGIVNMIIAQVANKNHYLNINDRVIYGKTVKPHETITGIIVLDYSNYDPLIFSYKTN